MNKENLDPTVNQADLDLRAQEVNLDLKDHLDLEENQAKVESQDLQDPRDQEENVEREDHQDQVDLLEDPVINLSKIPHNVSINLLYCITFHQIQITSI